MRRGAGAVTTEEQRRSGAEKQRNAGMKAEIQVLRQPWRKEVAGGRYEREDIEC